MIIIIIFIFLPYIKSLFMNTEGNNHIENSTTETSQNFSISELLGAPQTPTLTTQTVDTVEADEQIVEQNEVESTQQETTEKTTDPTPEINDDIVLEYLKNKGKEVNSLDEITGKEEDPYNELLTDEDKAYLNYKKQTGGSREDFDAINRNWDEVSPVEAVKAKILKETGVDLNDEDATDYIESELGVDLSSDELSAIDKIKIKSYLKDFIKSQKEEQNKYKQAPVENKEQKNEEFVTLDNGTVMKKADYDKRLNEYNKYIETNKEAVNSVTDYSFSISIDENGTKKELNYKFDLTDEDRHSMLSITTDTSKHINENYLTENGFDQKRFNEDMFWSVPKNREKVIGALLHQARAEAIERLMKQRGNVNLHPHRGLPTSTQKEGVKTMSISDIINS